ncbi:unnamed protein product, partial [Didymodactylos carnosus]
MYSFFISSFKFSYWYVSEYKSNQLMSLKSPVTNNSSQNCSMCKNIPSQASCCECYQNFCLKCLKKHLSEKLLTFDNKIRKLQENFGNLYTDDMIENEMKVAEQQIVDWHRENVNKLNRILDDTKRNIYQTGKESELKLKKWQQENTSKLNNIREK